MSLPHYHPLMSLRHVGLCYRRQRGLFGDEYWALKDVSFDLYPGETLGVLGRNGAGKSSLMRLMAGIVKPDRGRLINYGFKAALLSLRLGFMSHLSGRENAILSGMLMGLHRAEIEALMPAIIEFSELYDFIDEPVSTYSSGMSARLGFAVAFQLDPDILLVDEVMGVGDEDFNRKSTELMKERIRTDKTVVLISHNASQIKQLCDRAVWIEDGVTQLQGPPAEVVEAYHDHITAERSSKTSAA